MNNQPLVLFCYLVIFIVTYSSGGPLCSSNNMMCIDLHNFQECTNDQDFALGLVTACPEGEICDDSDGTVVCRRDHSPTTITKLSVTPPSCFASGKYPAETCYEYYECVAAWWWWEPELKSCPEGQAFDAKLGGCSIAAWFNCQPTTTIIPTATTTVPITTTTSPTTTTMVATTTTAIPTVTTTVETTTKEIPTTTHVSPVTVPACFDASKYPAETCYEYYECVRVLLSWQPELKSCPEGQAFDAKLDECTIAAWFNCQPATTTTTVSMTTTTVPVTTTMVPTTVRTATTTTTILTTTKTVPMTTPTVEATTTTEEIPTTTHVSPITVPACFDSGKYPAETCYEYYECVRVLLWWQPELKSCPEGQAFDAKFNECTMAAWVNCQPTTTTTVPMTTTTVPITTTTMVPTTIRTAPPTTTTVPTTTTAIPTTTRIVPMTTTTTTIEEIPTTTHVSPITVPACFDSSKYPAETCYEYYECVRVLLWWQPELKSCPEGQAFDAKLDECTIDAWFNCQPATTTTVPVTTTTVPVTTTMVPTTATAIPMTTTTVETTTTVKTTTTTTEQIPTTTNVSSVTTIVPTTIRTAPPTTTTVPTTSGVDSFLLWGGIHIFLYQVFGFQCSFLLISLEYEIITTRLEGTHVYCLLVIYGVFFLTLAIGI